MSSIVELPVIAELLLQNLYDADLTDPSTPRFVPQNWVITTDSQFRDKNGNICSVISCIVHRYGLQVRTWGGVEVRVGLLRRSFTDNVLQCSDTPPVLGVSPTTLSVRPRVCGMLSRVFYSRFCICPSPTPRVTSGPSGE